MLLVIQAMIYIIGRQLKNKQPYFKLNPPSLDIQEEDTQKMFNLWQFLQSQQDSEQDQYIKDLIHDNKSKLGTTKIDVSRSHILSNLS